MNAAIRPLLIALLLLTTLTLACTDDATGPDTDTPVPDAVEIEPATATLTAIGEVVRLNATVLDQDGAPIPGAPVLWESLHPSVATVSSGGSVVAVAPGTARIEASLGAAAELATVTVDPAPTSVSIEPGLDTLNALADTVRFTATVQDSSGTVISDAVVNWESLDETVATVDPEGRAVAVGTGTTRIRATAGATSVEATLVARQVPASIEVTPPAVTLAENETAQLSAVVTDSNGTAVAGAPVAWGAADTLTATVDDTGLATGIFQGTAAITATSAGITGETAVRVLGRISYTAFTQQNDGSYVRETYVMNTDGSGVERLDFLLETDEDIVWSPDRSRVAFVSERSGDDDIWVANADGSGTPLNLTADTAFDAEPAWSADGQMIAYRSRITGDDDVWIRNADGSGTPVNITDDAFPAGHPAWSPDGLSLAFAQSIPDTAKLTIYVTYPFDTAILQQRITDSDSPYSHRYPAWSPDGEAIAFVSGPLGSEDIYVMNIDGTDRRRLTHTAATETTPAWSPDGRRIVYVSARHGNAELYMVDVETGEETRLTHSAVHELGPEFLPRPAP